MRHVRYLVVACLPLLIAVSAGARPASDPSLSQDLLRIWNQGDPTVDTQAPDAVTPQRYDLYLLSSPDYLHPQQEPQTATEPAPVGYTAPDGSSLTPHIDRLMRQVSGVPATPEAVTPFSPSGPATLGSEATNSNMAKSHDDNQIQRYRRRDTYTQPGCPTPEPTPEPGTLLLLGAAAAALKLRRR